MAEAGHGGIEVGEAAAVEELMARADAALYEAKAAGGNKARRAATPA